MPTDNHFSTSFRERREPDEIDKATRPGYLPGVTGVAVQLAIEHLAASEEDCSVVIEKRRNAGGKFSITVNVKK
ncbi:hypothetical protein EJD96_00055 (plasmid) [Herbaspirillum seropedicae]|uniref:hypothetical protein n=1 Tax=Herbaspirillum seropedicae TaxID=964 RepID=UPI001122E297|nr:hypothetical protein [Herbaspirillum seropedicae]QDD62646.1 hypothetical protein EJD96_00055 [Herbaspirillum seropedicae]